MKKPTKEIQMLGPQMTLEGTLVFEGTMIINGHVKGTIESKEGTIVIGEKAVIHSDVFVHTATISGEVRGLVRAADRIELHPPARVFGDLTAPVVIVDAGVTFDGRCNTSPADGAFKESCDAMEVLPEQTAKAMKSLGSGNNSSVSLKGDKKGAGISA